MASKYQYENEFSSSAPKVLGASLTNEVLTGDISLTAGGSTKSVRFEVVTAAVTVGAGITLAAQSQLADGTWVAVSGLSASVTAAGCSVLSMNANSAAGIAAMPLAKLMRVVVTTGAGSAVTVNSVRFLQPE